MSSASSVTDFAVDSVDDSVGSSVVDTVTNFAVDSVGDSVGSSVIDTLTDFSVDSVGDSVGSSVVDTVTDFAVDSVGDSIGSSVVETVTDSILDSLDDFVVNSLVVPVIKLSVNFSELSKTGILVLSVANSVSNVVVDSSGYTSVRALNLPVFGPVITRAPTSLGDFVACSDSDVI
jgi:uncharacterized phage infection (PIP) family protein YhgE